MSWTITKGTGPLVITAIHAGHQLRHELLQYMALDEGTRLREEDPYTDQWTFLSSNRVVVDTSRFEVDLNRHPEDAVYMKAADAWGLTVWKAPLPDNVVQRSRAQWRSFYDEMVSYLDEIHAAYGRLVVLDIHSYCHRRGGPRSPPDDPARNPEINLGTGSLNAGRWSPLVDKLMGDLRAFDLGGDRRLDVRENVNFRGGYFSKWINHRYGTDACAIAVELKKTFMDEWTGELDQAKLDALKRALASTLPGISEKLADDIENYAGSCTVLTKHEVSTDDRGSYHSET